LVLLKRLGNNDVGTPNKVGGNDWDELYDYHNGVNLAGRSATISTPTTFNNATLDADLNTILDITDNEISAQAQIAYTKVTTSPSSQFLKYVYWWIFIDPSDGNKYKATNGVTNFESIDDVGYIFEQIFATLPTKTTPIHIFVGPGEYQVKSWNGANSGRSNQKIRGCGSGVTSFNVTNDVQVVNGTNRVFNCEANATQFTQISLQVDAPKNTWAVMTDTNTDLVAGCYVILGSSLQLPLSATDQGEYSRIVKIVDTGAALGTTGKYRIILEKSTRFNYLTADTAFIRRLDFYENIHWEGFTIKSNQDLTNSTGFMRFDFCSGVHLKDIKFQDWGKWSDPGFHICLTFNVVVNSIIDDCEFELSPERGHGTGQNNGGYGISLRAGCETVWIDHCRFRGMIRHSITTTGNGETMKQGWPMNIWIVNSNSETTGENSFDSHGEGEFLTFINCSTHSSRSDGATDSTEGGNDTDSFGNRCNYTRYINCTVVNNRGTAFSFGDGTHGHQMFNCFAKNIKLDRSALSISADDVVVTGFTAEDVDSRALIIQGGATNVTISGLVSRNTNTNNLGEAPVRIEGSAKNIDLSHFMIDLTNAPTRNPISTDTTVDGITISHITVTGGTGRMAALSGSDIKIDETTCRGKGLATPRYKIGRFEGNANNGTGLWEGQITDTGGSKRVETTDGTFREYSQSTLNALEGFRVSTYTEEDQDPYLRIRFRLENTTGLRFFCGFSSDDTQLGPAGADPLVSKSGFMIKFDSAISATNMVLYYNSGGASPTTGATVTTVDTNSHTIELRCTDAGAGFQWRWDYGPWSALISTNVPGGTTDLGIQFYIENNETGVAKTLNMLEAHTEIPNR
jgi:hypothetical protein